MSEPTKNATNGRPSKQRILPDRYHDNRLWGITEAVSCIPYTVPAGMLLLHMTRQFADIFSSTDSRELDFLNHWMYAWGVAIVTWGVLQLLVPYVVCLFARRPVMLPCPHCGAKPEAKGWFSRWWHCPNPQCPGYDRPGGWETRRDWNRWAGVVREFLDTDRKCACCGKTISVNVGLRDGNACYVASCDCATGMGGRIENALDDRANNARQHRVDEDVERRRRSDADAQRRRMEKYADALNADALAS